MLVVWQFIELITPEIKSRVGVNTSAQGENWQMFKD